MKCHEIDRNLGRPRNEGIIYTTGKKGAEVIGMDQSVKRKCCTCTLFAQHERTNMPTKET